MSVSKDVFNGQPYDKLCSCGEHVVFRQRKMGGLEPVCLEHGVNHFADCPDRARYRREKQKGGLGPQQTRLEV